MIKLDDNKKAVVEDFGKRLHLIPLLRITSTEANESNVGLALENLKQLYQSVSLINDCVQRVIAYFDDGLVARLLTKKSPFYDMIMKEPTSEEEF